METSEDFKREYSDNKKIYETEETDPDPDLNHKCQTSITHFLNATNKIKMISNQ